MVLMKLRVIIITIVCMHCWLGVLTCCYAVTKQRLLNKHNDDDIRFTINSYSLSNIYEARGKGGRGQPSCSPASYTSEGYH